MPAGGAAHKISAVANDLGKYIEEADLDNNRRDEVINITQTAFADLVLTSMTVGTTSGSTVAWNAGVPITIQVKNEAVPQPVTLGVDLC
jgi:subtilase family serine protease